MLALLSAAHGMVPSVVSLHESFMQNLLNQCAAIDFLAFPRSVNLAVRYRLVYGNRIAWFLRRHSSISTERFRSVKEPNSLARGRKDGISLARFNRGALYKFGSASDLIRRNRMARASGLQRQIPAIGVERSSKMALHRRIVCRSCPVTSFLCQSGEQPIH